MNFTCCCRTLKYKSLLISILSEVRTGILNQLPSDVCIQMCAFRRVP